jgi:pimeloyl-ACP methyl ester carboxylesterase
VLDGELWEERMDDLGGVMGTGDGDEGLWVRLAAARAKGELCAKRGDEEGDVRRHMSTAYAARDMLEILKKLGDHSSQSSRFGDSKSSEIPKLQFLGISYGSMVDQTFVRLYPEYVSRMVLDGAVSGEDWTGKWQMKHLIDIDAVWASFYDDCFEAREACPLGRELDSESADIKDRVSKFLEILKERQAYTVSDENARLITYREVRLAIYWTTMSPAFASPVIAAVLDALMRGHTSITLSFPFENENLSKASDCPDQETQDSRAGSNVDAGTAVNCGDAEDITNSSIEDFKEYLSALENQSSVAAFFQGERRIRCLGWPIRPAWRFSGPFISKTDNGGSKLETPILFTGNRLDPMTSLRNSHEVAKDFPGSVILE